MIPILLWPGVIIPGQFGPISRQPFLPTKSTALTISTTGTPSVIATIKGISAAAASIIASAANAGGTRIIEAFASVALTASSTELKIGTPSKSCPPFPGVTPATTFVP